MNWSRREKTYDDEVSDEGGELSDGDLGGTIDGGEDDLRGLANEGSHVDDGGRDRGGDLADDGLNDINGAVARGDELCKG